MNLMNSKISSLFTLSNTDKKEAKKKDKKDKRNTEIGLPSDFKHVLHIGSEGVLIRRDGDDENNPIDLKRSSTLCPIQPQPQLQPPAKKPATEFERSQSESPLHGSKTLPKNFAHNRHHSFSNVAPSPLDIPIPTVTDQQMAAWSLMYSKAKSHSRPLLHDVGWGPENPRSSTRLEESLYNEERSWSRSGTVSSTIINNSNYMSRSELASLSRSTHGTISSGLGSLFPTPMGTTSSIESKRLIENRPYVDASSLNKYREKSMERRKSENPTKGILKPPRADSGLNLNEIEDKPERQFQQAPFSGLGANSVGRRIRSSTTGSKGSPKSTPPSPLARPQQLEFTGTRNEGAVTVIPTPVIPNSFEEEHTEEPQVSCGFTDVKTMSIYVEDERPLSARQMPEASMIEDSFLNTKGQELVIIHL